MNFNLAQIFVGLVKNAEKLVFWTLVLVTLIVGIHLATERSSANRYVSEEALRAKGRFNPAMVNKELEKEVEKVSPVLEGRPLSYYQDILERNLFEPFPLVEGTETPKPDTEITTPKPPPPLNLVCRGISFIEGREPMAFLYDRDSQKRYYVRRGDKLDKYKILDILPEKVIIYDEISGEERVLELPRR